MMSSRLVRSLSTAAYTRPLAPGRLAAYDEAVAYLAQDSARKRAALDKLVQDGHAHTPRARQLAIDAYINDDEVRWRAREGLADLTMPVHRHLARQQWTPRLSILVSTLLPLAAYPSR